MARCTLARIDSYRKVPDPNTSVMTRHSPALFLNTAQKYAGRNTPIAASATSLIRQPTIASAAHAVRNTIQFHGGGILPHFGPMRLSIRYAGAAVHTEYTKAIPNDRATSRPADPRPFTAIATNAQTRIVKASRTSISRLGLA